MAALARRPSSAPLGRPHIALWLLCGLPAAVGVLDPTPQSHPFWSPGCWLKKEPILGRGLRQRALELPGREYQLYIPDMYKNSSASPLWILAPGAYETAKRFLDVSGMQAWANKHNIAFAALESAEIQGFNVGLHVQPIPGMPDDVEYTKSVLRDASRNLCLDMDRVRCVGYSRGARFCVRLASELSTFVKGIAPVAGLRYPLPNNATWPMPIIAIHGARDRINPYWGAGDPSYWNASVPDAVAQWAKFNECQVNQWVHMTKHTVLHQHFRCRENASVVLAMIAEGGHTWPGSGAFEASQFGITSQEVNANDLIQQFFMRHPRRSPCHTAKEGELCFGAVTRAMQEGVAMHPEWAQRITAASTFEDYQSLLHDEILADCPKPCSPMFRYV